MTQPTPHSALRTPHFCRNLSPYLTTALRQIPRLLGSIDRNPFRATHGSCDRQYWHYRTAAFPSEMHQEAVLPLALVYAHELPGNRWYQAPRLREWIVAALRFSAQSAHADGSCDDYYPYERALGAAVFSLCAAAEAYRLLALDDRPILDSFVRRAEWIAEHGESGTLTNHHALAALALARVAQLTGEERLQIAARRKVGQVLSWQSDEGWFHEYGGADAGYQSVTIDCLAKLREMWSDELPVAELARVRAARSCNTPELWRVRLPEGVRPQDPLVEQIDTSLLRGVAFARRCLHPDGSYGGEYGSRGTYHFYPHGFELLARRSPAARELADAFLTTLADQRQADFADDRMYVHRLGNLIEAYFDGCAESTPANATEAVDDSPTPEYLPHAQWLVDRAAGRHTIISAARGGVVKHFVDDQLVTTDTGLVLETTDGRIAVSQLHDLNRLIRRADVTPHDTQRAAITVVGPLHWTRFETATPLKQAVLHLGMITVGRWCRDLVRRVLQRRVITGRRAAPITLSRTIELLNGSPSLRITDRLTLDDPRVSIRRLSASSDLEAAYVAASGVYHDSVLQPWTALDEYVARLNRERTVTVVRQW